MNRGWFRGENPGHDLYLVYLNNQEPENGSLKTIDLNHQKTAP